MYMKISVIEQTVQTIESVYTFEVLKSTYNPGNVGQSGYTPMPGPER